MDEVWRRLIERHPGLSALRGTSRLSCNEAYADEATRFSNDDVVAVIPPVSGG
jgi:molybdopterin converting factor small subunit